MISEPGIIWTKIPVPSHRGIIISPGVLKFYTLEEIKMVLICENFDTGFETIDKITEIKLIQDIIHDSIWIVKWQNRGKFNFGVILGSEF